MKLKEIKKDLLVYRKEPFLPLDSSGSPVRGKLVEKDGKLVERRVGTTIVYYVFVVYENCPHKIQEVPISAIAAR